MNAWRGMIGILWAMGGIWACAQAADTPEGGPEQQPIAAVQALLRQERLYDGPVDGMEGPETVAAIRRYQMLHGLRVTGRLEPDTLRAMLLPAPPPSRELAASDRELLRELAQAPLPDAVAERRKPIPPAEPPAALPAKPEPGDAKAKKVGRSKSRPHRTGGSRLMGD